MINYNHRIPHFSTAWAAYLSATLKYQHHFGSPNLYQYASPIFALSKNMTNELRATTPQPPQQFNQSPRFFRLHGGLSAIRLLVALLRHPKGQF